MVGKYFSKLFGSRNERVVKKLQKNVAQINELEPTYAELDDAARDAGLIAGSGPISRCRLRLALMGIEYEAADRAY